MRKKLLQQAVIILWCFCCGGVAATQDMELQDFVGEFRASRIGEAQSRLLSSKKNLVTADAMNALINQGDQLYYQEKYSETFTAYGLALQLAERIGDATTAARITRLMGDTRYFQGQYGPARGLYQKSLALSKGLQNKELRLTRCSGSPVCGAKRDTMMRPYRAFKRLSALRTKPGLRESPRWQSVVVAALTTSEGIILQR